MSTHRDYRSAAPATPRTVRTEPAITIGVVTYLGRSRIPTTLAALLAQDVDPTAFEILVVCNGPDDGTSTLVRDLGTTCPVSIRVVSTPTASMGYARNIALHAARGAYIAWVDDDDWISPNFVSSMMALARPDCVVLPVVADVDLETGQINFDNYINKRTMRNVGRVVSPAALPTVAAFDAGKVIPCAAAKRVAYDTTLRSGLDVLYWAEAVAECGLSARVPALESAPVYYRAMRDGSASRQYNQLFERERLYCIEKLTRLKERHPAASGWISGLQSGQASHLGRSLRLAPERRPSVISAIRELDLQPFPYAAMNEQSTEQLAILYAFPPVMDTSAMVAAKRLWVAGEPYDLLTHSMRPVRGRDATTTALTTEHQGHRVEISGTPVSAHLGLLTNFAQTGFARLRRHADDPYRRVYSRAMWPAAHFAGAAYKVRHPESTWTAEFSDPLLINIMGEERVADLPRTPVVDEITEAALATGVDVPTENFWAWLETVTFALADRVVFTNPLQRDLMMEHVSHPDLAARVLPIAEVSPQPTLPEAFYSLASSDHYLEPGRIHLGYFGVFYGAREVSDLVAAFTALDKTDRSGIMLHIFTSQPDEAARTIVELGLDDCVRASGYVGFFEFLALTKRLDWLIVADARVAATHGVNPYLPSKYADYVGSGTPIWSLVEPGSMLSQLPAAMVSEIGDIETATEFLRSVARRDVVGVA